MSFVKRINPAPFYGQWSGHPLSGLTTLYNIARTERPNTPIVYLAGDSSLDNKAWVTSSGPGGDALPVVVPDIYNAFLDPPQPKPDVAFWMNHFLGPRATVINAAVEATMLRDRDAGLLGHDEFIRDHIRPEDVLIVSVGANDIALSPNTSTMRHMMQLSWVTSLKSIKEGTASSLGYFKEMFGSQTQAYISGIIAKQKPRVVVVCMIYFPLEAEFSEQSSWADTQLKVLGYGRNPAQLQAAIKKIFEQGTSSIRLEGTTVVPCALFKTMDGKMKEDYTARVEPSVQGGRKMSAQLKDILANVL